MTGPQSKRTTLSGETAAILQPAKSVPSAWCFKAPSVKSLQPGVSIPVILVVARQVGKMENSLLGLGNRKAVEQRTSSAVKKRQRGFLLDFSKHTSRRKDTIYLCKWRTTFTGWTTGPTRCHSRASQGSRGNTLSKIALSSEGLESRPHRCGQNAHML